MLSTTDTVNLSREKVPAHSQGSTHIRVLFPDNNVGFGASMPLAPSRGPKGVNQTRRELTGSAGSCSELTVCGLQTQKHFAGPRKYLGGSNQTWALHL